MLTTDEHRKVFYLRKKGNAEKGENYVEKVLYQSITSKYECSTSNFRKYAVP